MTTKTKILDSAEKMVRTGGYNGFSFREIAAEIGIKSSSVHHHFPTKQLLAEAVAQRYMDNFFDALGEPAPEGATTQGQFERYYAVFHSSFASTNRSCLCGVLSNETLDIPLSVAKIVDQFVENNVAWLSQAIALEVDSAETEKIHALASTIYAALEGAISMAALKQDVQWLTIVSKTMGNFLQNSINQN